MTTIKTKFNPEDHMENIKGKAYLPVAWRLVWFREEHPDWTIETDVKDDTAEKRATAKAYIKDETGRVIATGHKTARPRGMIADYVELAETGSIGRALAYCGFGTQFSPELDEGEDNIVDSPQAPKSSPQPIQEPQKAKEDVKTDFLLRGKQKAFFATATQAGYGPEEAKELAKGAYKVTSFNDLQGKQLDALIGWMAKRVKKPEVSNDELDNIAKDMGLIDLDNALGVNENGFDNQ
jgi:hypothetical protein